MIDILSLIIERKCYDIYAKNIVVFGDYKETEIDYKTLKLNNNLDKSK